MSTKDYTNKYQSFVFNLDDVIYPERDFLLQVYYLFAQFMEYTRQLPAQELLDFMKSTYEVAGREELFKKAAEKFAIEAQYETNFDLLHQTARLPLKLLLYPAVQEFMQDLVANKKDLYLLVSGTPEGQLNKIRQFEWAELAAHLRVYFSEEITASMAANPLRYIVDIHSLQPGQTLVLGLTPEDEAMALSEGIKFLKADKLFLN